jgi:hypothetical protein
MLADLGRRGINELHVEAGGQLNGSLVREGLVDEYLIYLAPKLLGSGLDMAAFGPLASLAHAPQLRFHDIERVGCDVRILARPLALDAEGHTSSPTPRPANVKPPPSNTQRSVPHVSSAAAMLPHTPAGLLDGGGQPIAL